MSNKPTVLGFEFNSKALRELLKEKHVRQSELSELTGIKRNSISRYCSGEHQPRLPKLRLIAKTLGVPEEALMIKTLVVKENETVVTPKMMKFCPGCGTSLLEYA